MAAAALALTAAGDLFVLAVLLGLAAGDALAGGAAALVALTCLIRFGSTGLQALAGAQSVLGPAGLSGSVLAAASAWFGAAALVVAAPAGVAGLAFGAAAGVVVAGPAAGTPGGLLVRIVGLAGGAALAWVVGARPGWRPWPASALGGAAVVLAALARR